MTALPPHERRAAILRRLGHEQFDVLVIGGGITGAGIARDAALRGLRTALLEQNDFASGTSSRSSRLIHGGLRYLEHGHVHLVFESSRERRTLLRVAAHLVRPLPFTWPVYRGARISRAKLFTGLALYDLLALFRNVGRHDRLSRAQVLAGEPALRSDDLLGGAAYYDASTDDARLTLANVIGADEAGAAVLNYVNVVELLVSGGRAVGVAAVDALGTGRISVRAQTVVNATGPWSDAVRQLESIPPSPTIVGSKGSHIAVRRGRVGNRQAVTMLHPRDGRVMFALPAGERTIFGTTEALADAGPTEIRASRADVEYLLAAANAYFPGAQLVENDVIAAWAGIRPLVAGKAVEDTGSASREHAVTRGTLGMLSVTGGKLTTYRAMAQEIVDRIVRDQARRDAQHCRTAKVPLPGAERAEPDRRRPAAEVVPSSAARERLISAHGSRWSDVWRLAAAEPRLAEPVGADSPYLAAEFVYAIRHELAFTLGDLLIRRTPAAFESSDHAVDLAPRVASLVGPEMGWDEDRQRNELARYEREVERMFGINPK